MLNDSQKKAVAHGKGPCLVLGTPGSGKTTVITQRLKKLIEKDRIDPSKILVITFTRAAAKEMQIRFERLINEENGKVTFGTFHAVFFMILKYAYHFQTSNIITEEKKYQVMREILSHYHLDYDDENEFIVNLFVEISMIKNNRILLENYYTGLCSEEMFRSIVKKYQRILHDNKWIDFDDMLLYTYELFAKRKDILAAWQKKYQFILVDEFQDINQIQYDVLKMLALPENNLFVVGDDDQSIYRFRGSKPEIMLNFEKDFPNMVRILLDINYRSQAAIVEMATKVIEHNETRFTKAIIAHNKKSGEVETCLFESPKEEIQFLKERIQHDIKNGGNYQDHAILFRTNTQPRMLMEVLMEYNIPFHTREKIPNIYEHWIAKDIFTYINVANGSTKRKDFLQIMNRPKRYISRESLPTQNVDFFRWKQYYKEQQWILERLERLEYDLRMVRNMSPYAAINYIRKGIGYDDFLKEFAQYRNIKADDLYEIIDELQMTAKGYKSFHDWQIHIERYMEELRKTMEQRNNQKDAVILATLHSSKGLEFENVYIMDVNEGIIPYKKAVQKKEIEEERRMFYVGMTRAKNNLVLCSVKTLNNKTMEVSRFLTESNIIPK